MVSSMITYDNGVHTVIKLDNFYDYSLLPNISQERSYFYNNMTTVKVILDGTHNGDKVNTVTGILTAAK